LAFVLANGVLAKWFVELRPRLDRQSGFFRAQSKDFNATDNADALYRLKREHNSAVSRGNFCAILSKLEGQAVSHHRCLFGEIHP
jgi:hypothetical protein